MPGVTPSKCDGLTPFGSRSVAAHVLRGLAGFALLAVAVMYASRLGWWTILPAVGALVMFRGCPMCWTAGLVETVLRRWRKPVAASAESSPDPTRAPLR